MPPKAKMTITLPPKASKTKKKNKAPKAATHASGPSALTRAVTTLPVFQKSQHMQTNQLYYSYQEAITAASPTPISTEFYIANGLYDPDITGVGHQPIGFDELMGFYEQYTVVRSRISVTFINNGTFGARCCVSLSPDITAITDPIRYMENGYVRSVFLDAAGSVAAAGGYGTGQRVGTVNLDCDVTQYFGKRSQQELLNDTTLAGTVAANPTEGVYFAVSVIAAHSSTGSIDVSYDVLISYDAIYWEPRKKTVSTVTRTVRMEDLKHGPLPPSPRLESKKDCFEPEVTLLPGFTKLDLDEYDIAVVPRRGSSQTRKVN